MSNSQGMEGRFNMIRRCLIAKCLLTVACLAVSGLGFVPPGHAAGQPPITIFAAASTTNAITEINALFEARGLGRTTVAFAASSTLAKQIDRGAPADIFLSANHQWMDYLTERGTIEAHNRFDLLGNHLVLIAPADADLKGISIVQGFPLATLLGEGRMAMGDPAHVPAGMYGKQALVSLGVWDTVVQKLAPAKDVRTALVLVARREAPMGLVYATDAAISTRVRILAMFPQTSHPAITYPVAIVKGRNNDASRQYLKFLTTPEARMIFEKFGFFVR